MRARRQAVPVSEALVLIDIQNDYFPGGAMELQGTEAAAEKARRVLEHFRAAGKPVVHVRHLATQQGASFFVPRTPGSETHELVEPLSREPVIEKHFPSAFRETGLDGLLRELGADRLVFVGMMTHMCVDTTVRAAFDLGYACTLLHDACATRDLSFLGETVPAAQVHAAFMAALGPRFANVISVGQYLEAESGLATS
jgi:nicotinamidase-related amidase